MIAKPPNNEFAWEKANSFFPEPFEADTNVYISKADREHSKELRKNHNVLSFLADKTKIREVEKLVQILKDKRKYVVHIKNLDQA